MMISNRELRSLGLLPQKRKLLVKPELSDSRTKKVRMDVPNVFDEFISTVNKVLRSYRDHDKILNALRRLALLVMVFKLLVMVIRILVGVVGL